MFHKFTRSLLMNITFFEQMIIDVQNLERKQHLLEAFVNGFNPY